MQGGNEALERSDAWLLLALIYAGEPADRRRIIEVGDAINHAIFTEEEMEGGLRRLEAAGHVVAAGGRFGAAEPVMEWFERVSPKRSRMFKDLDRVRRFLGISEPPRRARCLRF
jgi:hypothetical protein